MHVDRVAYGEVVEDREIVVSGDVEGSIVAQGGSARVVVFGNVKPTARIGASGGGAKIVLFDDVSERALVHARGGGATVVVLGRMVP